MSTQPIQLGRRPQKPAEQESLVRRTKQLAWLGVGWHGVEAAIAVGAGLAASSIALIGFGVDSLIESSAGFILLWRFAASRATSDDAERRAQRLIAVSFYAIAAYVGFEAVRSLLTGDRPEASWVGIGLAAVTLVTMPPLAIAKGRIAERLGSSATKSEGQQNMLAEHAVRLPLGRPARRSRGERPARAVVGGPRDGARHSGSGGQGGPRVVAG
jgi:hypothetical protein